ncbi:hypothetical protein QOT17_015023 [Balamuthia mandrillaris]
MAESRMRSEATVDHGVMEIRKGCMAECGWCLLYVVLELGDGAIFSTDDAVEGNYKRQNRALLSAEFSSVINLWNFSSFPSPFLMFFFLSFLFYALFFYGSFF